MDHAKTKLDHILNILASIVALGFAYTAFNYANKGDLGNALIFGGGALSFALKPFSNMPLSFYTLPMKELKTEMQRRPEPLWMRVMTTLCWVLVVAGLYFAIIGK
jgi:hypothetical protein